MANKRANRERLIARIAARQYGLITIAQLANAGLGTSGVSSRAKAGRLHRIYRGVYAVGSPVLSQEGQWLAAVLACGDDAVLSHHSAAALWALRRPRGEIIHVTVPGQAGRRRRAGLVVHRSGTLSATTVTRRRGIPVTTPKRTIADLRSRLPPEQLAMMIREAEARRLLLGADGEPGPAPVRSELEVRFLALCRRHRLPEPAVNARVHGFEVDFLWRDQRLIVETDGYRFHHGRIAFEEDRARDLDLRAQGYEVIRLTIARSLPSRSAPRPSSGKPSAKRGSPSARGKRLHTS